MNGLDETTEPLVLLDVRQLDRMPSLPAWLQQRIDALGSECQADNTGKYRLTVVLPRAMMLRASERAVVEERAADRASWLDGKRHDFDWPPAPATLRRLAQMELAPIKAEMVQLEKLLIAVPRLELSDEHRAKMRARFAELLKTLQAN
jgi:hypothetical protein